MVNIGSGSSQMMAELQELATCYKDKFIEMQNIVYISTFSFCCACSKMNNNIVTRDRSAMSCNHVYQ